MQSPVVATPVQPLLPGQSPQGTPQRWWKVACCTVIGKEKHGTQKRTTTLNWKKGSDSKCLPFLWHVLCWLEIWITVWCGSPTGGGKGENRVVRDVTEIVVPWLLVAESITPFQIRQPKKVKWWTVTLTPQKDNGSHSTQQTIADWTNHWWIPSRELTYPPKMAFWRWFSFSQGGIC